MALQLELHISIDPPFRAALAEGWLRRVVQSTLAVEGIDYPLELGLVITGSQAIRELNRSYRGRDEDTDVLAFALREEAGDTPFVTPPDGVSRLGEVLVSYPQAEIQAGERGHSTERELALLVTHGVLHLLGYDHEAESAAAKMRAAEERAMLELGHERVL